MSSKDIIAFTDAASPPLSEVGGKGLSLLRMAKAGLAVPGGFVLTTTFFEPWLATLRTTPAWAELQKAATGEMSVLAAACAALKEQANGLAFSPAQQDGVALALAAFPGGALFAVRSSSPEEDLEGASFAGGYETVLGVTRDRIEAAVRRAFASCLDGRVASYKREHGFDPANPRIAVIVQQQIASDVAGVGLSLNPITNAYDEAVFNANWGLGETVVSGSASPDLFIVDKVHRQVISRTVGKKETSLWLDSTGGVSERPDSRRAELTLKDPQLLALCDQLARIEDLYGRPMDIEWAFAGGELYLLQARPMTAFVALPADLVTPPGEAKRRLYFDVTLSVQGFAKPISVMGTSVLAALARGVSIQFVGRDVTGNLDVAVGVVRDGRLYAILSRPLAVFGKERIARAMRAFDPLAADALAAIDQERYARLRPPSPRTLWRFFRVFLRAVSASFRPQRYRARVDGHVAGYLASLPGLTRTDGSVVDQANALVLPTIRDVLLNILPAMAAWVTTVRRVRGLFPQPSEEEARHLRALDQSLPGNVTVEMGLELARMARAAPSIEALTRSPEWTAFLGRYGHRGPGELDIAAPRFREDPRLLLDQARSVATAAEDPAVVFERHQQERREAVESLAASLKRRGGHERRFRRWCAIIEQLGGLRETPKFLLIKLVDILRTRVQHEGQKLVAAGRIDRAADVFDLTMADLDEAARDASLDLRHRRAERRVPIDRLAQIKRLPRLIDSRGLILRAPPRELRPGELSGQAVSEGIARGPAKVLQTPDEKPLLPGEILVAHATDPGWTPLFVNAAAVVLEIGGVLQHGALVAREYGKPCVTGVEEATERLKDGQLIEVDGAAGTVRLIDRP